MGRIHRYRTAWQRHHRSRGYGIHSPFAFNFVLNVLRERLPYYNYAYLKQLRQAIVERTSIMRRHPRVMSYKNAKMLFRIANYFNPRVLLQIGTCYGYSTASVMSVSRESRLLLYAHDLDRYPVVANVLQPFLDYIECYNQLGVALNDYITALGDEAMPFVLISEIESDDIYSEVVDFIEKRILQDEGVIIIRNISKSDTMKKLWHDCHNRAIHGHTYTNEKLAIIVSLKHLPLQHFLLWF